MPFHTGAKRVITIADGNILDCNTAALGAVHFLDHLLERFFCLCKSKSAVFCSGIV